MKPGTVIVRTFCYPREAGVMVVAGGYLTRLYYRSGLVAEFIDDNQDQAEDRADRFTHSERPLCIHPTAVI